MVDKVTLLNKNHLNQYLFFIFRTPYSSHTSQLLEIRMKLSIFHFHLVFAIQGHFFVTGVSNRRTCQLFFQVFHMKYFRFSGIRITYKILLSMQQGTPRFLCIFIYICIYEKTLIVQPSTETKIGTFLVQHKNQHFQAFGTDTQLSEHGRTFSG